jgi:hypothetical protein
MIPLFFCRYRPAGTTYRVYNLAGYNSGCGDVNGCEKRGNQPFPHPHVICVQCKKIIDPDLGSLKDITVEAAKETSFEILSHRLDFFGICGDCKTRNKDHHRPELNQA